MRTTMMALAAGLGILVSPAAMAADYGMAGCGLGSMLIKDDGIVQIFAATTNGTSYSQTFGITIGTSNCVSDGVVMADKEQEAFTELNLDNLQRDMAAGQGEYLAAFVTLLGCSEAVRPTIYNFAQASYPITFPTENTTPMQALYGFKVMASQDHQLAAGCSRI